MAGSCPARVSLPRAVGRQQWRSRQHGVALPFRTGLLCHCIPCHSCSMVRSRAGWNVAEGWHETELWELRESWPNQVFPAGSGVGPRGRRQTVGDDQPYAGAPSGSATDRSRGEVRAISGQTGSRVPTASKPTTGACRTGEGTSFAGLQMPSAASGHTGKVWGVWPRRLQRSTAATSAKTSPHQHRGMVRSVYQRAGWHWWVDATSQAAIRGRG